MAENSDTGLKRSGFRVVGEEARTKGAWAVWLIGCVDRTPLWKDIHDDDKRGRAIGAGFGGQGL